MPELPEVETFRSALSNGTPEHRSLIGEVIQGARILWEGVIAVPSPRVFREKIVGQVINDIQRRGKYLVFHLSRNYLLLHLRMSGDLLVEMNKAPIPPHHRLILEFKSGWRLGFNDTRKFGRVWLVSDPQEILGDLGPEPLENTFTPLEFFRILQSHRRQIKPLLMDQRILAGLGNIYTDEALHLARIHPLTRSSEINREVAERLWRSIRETLESGIRLSGASIDWVYRGGEFQNYFRVYQRAGEPCPVCGTLVERITVGQRGTHFCPQCQKAPV